MEINQIYKNKDVIVTFYEDERDYFYAIKDREPLYLALRINIHSNLNGKKGEHIGQYFKEWKKEITINSNSFITNFLEKPEYRKDYFIDGSEWNGIISHSSDNGINKKCEEYIAAFYRKKSNKRNFKDFASLKTYGMDKFSRMKLDKIKDLVSDDIFEIANKSMDDDKQVANILKLHLRGLKIDDAIRKVKTDLEIANNIKGR